MPKAKKRAPIGNFSSSSEEKDVENNANKSSSDEAYMEETQARISGVGF